MYWSLDDSRVVTPAIPLYVCGTTKDFELILTTEAGDGLTNVYLALLDASAQGILQAQIEDGEFEEIGSLGQGTCWIGDIPDETTVTVTFRIALAVGFTDGLYFPTVVVVSGDASAAPVSFWTDDIDSFFTDTITDFYV